jgi:transcriptional regulator
MYPPRHHQDDNINHLISTIQQFPLATLISATGEDCFTTHIPLIYTKDDSTYGKLIGHLDKNNPQCALLDNRKVYIIFSGPNTYISPNTYTTVQLPTWNYIKVHVEGISIVNNEPDAIKKSMIEMTRFLETSDNPFVLEYDHPRMNQLVNYVTGIEITIARMEGKFKLSQDKIPADTKNAREKLIADSEKGLRNFIESVI